MLKHPLSLSTRLERMFMGPGEDEIFAVNKLVSQHDKQYKSINFGEDLIKEMIMSSMFGISVSANSAMSAYRLMRQRVARVAKNFGGFSDLNINAQEKLLKHNADLIISLRGAVFFEMKTGFDQIFTSLGFEDLQIAKNLIKVTLENDNTKEDSYKKIEYKKLNTIQSIDPHSAEEGRYNKLLFQTGAVVSFSQNLVKMLSYVLLFCNDFHDPEIDALDRSKITKARDSLIQMAQKYVFATYPEEMATTVFAGMMECMGNLRELCFIQSKRKNAHLALHNFNQPTTSIC